MSTEKLPGSLPKIPNAKNPFTGVKPFSPKHVDLKFSDAALVPKGKTAADVVRKAGYDGPHTAVMAHYGEELEQRVFVIPYSVKGGDEKKARRAVEDGIKQRNLKPWGKH